MTDDFLSIKVDIGEVWKKFEAAKRNNSESVMFFASFNNDKSETDNKPVYKSNNVAVWLKKKAEQEQQS